MRQSDNTLDMIDRPESLELPEPAPAQNPSSAQLV